jgi:hypothetical protein
MPAILATWELDKGGLWPKASPGKIMRPYMKTEKQKRVGSVVQVIECLPSKLETVSSNSSTSKKKMQRNPKSVRSRDRENWTDWRG